MSRERARKRRQFMWRSTLVLLSLGALYGLGYSAYQTGTELARVELRGLEQQVRSLSDKLDAARLESERLAASLAGAQQSAAALQKRYDAEIPAGPTADLYKLMQQRMTQGLTPARLAQVLRDTTATRACDTRTTRKRFAIQPPGARTLETVTFLDGLLSVAATAPAAGEPAGAIGVVIGMAWAQEPLKLKGLPVQQDIVINNAVLRLSVEPSELSGYGTATLSVCG
jgi:hypothetical protein